MSRQGDMRLVEQGRAKHRAGDFAGALGCYKRLLRKQPGQPDVLMLAAMAAGQAGQIEEAVRFARKAEQLRPDAKTSITLGRVLMQAQKWEEAAAVLATAAGDVSVGHDARFQLGQALIRLGREDEALDQFTQLVEQMPDHAPAWNELGRLQMGRGEPGLAARSFGESLRHRPGDAGTLSNLAAAHLDAGAPAEAEATVGEALRADPVHAGALMTLGILCKDQGRLAEAKRAFGNLLESSADNGNAWSGLAAVYQAEGDMDAAEDAYEKALAIDPEDTAALAGRAEWLEWQGRYQDGLDGLEQHVDEDAGTGVALVRARLLRRLGRADEGFRILSDALDDAQGKAVLRRQLLYSLGDACDDTHRYDDAFDFYRQANELAAAHYDPVEQGRLQDRLNTLTERCAGGSTGEQMLFILGMPRSGTTLVEQILSAHPDVYAAGELSLMGSLAMEALGSGHSLSDQELESAGERYLSALPGKAASFARVTDKMPLNFLYLGLLQAILPGARVIHCRRDPRDVALSCYFIDFIDPTLGFSTRMDWLGDYLNRYRQQMDRWRESLSLPLLEVDYEALVEEPERWSREIVEFAGLGWDPACLQFHEQQRVASTASHAQVRKPVYRSSVGRWRHYEKHLGPLLAHLDRRD